MEVVIAVDNEERTELGALDHGVDAIVTRGFGRGDARTELLEVRRVDVDEPHGDDRARVVERGAREDAGGTPKPSSGYQAARKSS